MNEASQVPLIRIDPNSGSYIITDNIFITAIPASRWQLTKKLWFPKWLLKFFPIRMVEYDSGRPLIYLRTGGQLVMEHAGLMPAYFVLRLGLL